MIGFIENFDSFSFNLVHYLEKGGASVKIFENHELIQRWNELNECEAFLIGPGPNEPFDSGELMQIIPKLVHLNKPILGVCLGHQALGQFFGWNLRRGQRPVHGKSSLIKHNGSGIFNGLDLEIMVGRYHSLVIEDASMIDDVQSSNAVEIEVTALTKDFEIMAFQHKIKPVFGVQFHPESVLTPQGQTIINNWLSLVNNPVTS